jgi:hypothetical protein
VTPGGHLVPLVGGDPGGAEVAQDAEQVLLYSGGLDQGDRLAGLLFRVGPIVPVHRQQ